MQPRPRRPTGITILAVLAIIGGIVLILGGAGLLALAGLLTVADLSGTALSGIDVALAQLIFTALGAVLLVLGVLYLILGVGYWGGKGWAWTLGIVVTIISLIVDIAQIAINPVSAAGNVFGLLLALIILYYLTRQHVKAFFGKAPWGPPGMGGPSMMSASTMGTSAPPPTVGTNVTVKCPSCGYIAPAGSTKCPNCGAML
jgi:uncharacterized membrane protein (DUF2068 family)